MLELYTRLRETILNLQKDVEKADKGNSTAARRVRRGLKEIKDISKLLRDASNKKIAEAPALAPTLAPKV